MQIFSFDWTTGDWATGDLAFPGVFLISFLAATVLPAQSEFLLVALLLAGEQDPWALTAVATAGNTLGSCVNWALGRWLRGFSGRRWFPVPEVGLAKAEALFKRWGLPSLLLAWAPLIGDPLTVVAGSLRVPFPIFLALVTLSKGGRYMVLTLGTLGLM